jgi:spermidine/putrescine transport system ATP-binding protein
MSVRKNIGFGLKMAKESRREIDRRVSEVLERVGLEGLGDRMPTELSGGQQQRVAVARALVNRPSVLLLDEPLGALDLKLRKRLQDELAEIHRSVRTTFVYVTHDQEEAMVLGTRIAVMNQGRLEQVGTPEEIYKRPRSRFVADFIGQANFLPVAFDGVQARTAGGVPVAVSSESFTTRGEATLVLRPEDVVLSDTAGDGPSLPARVLHYAFLGTHTRVVLSVAGVDDPFVVSVGGNAESLMRPESGMEVFLSWSPTAAVVVDEQPTAGLVQAEEEGDGIGIQPHFSRRVSQA